MRRHRLAVLAASVAAAVFAFSFILEGADIKINVGLGGKPAAAQEAGAVTCVSDYGAVPNDGTDDTAAVNRAIRACEKADTKELFFPGGTFNVSSITFPPSINVVMASGAHLEISNGHTVTFNGPFTAGLYEVFSGEGEVHFGNAAVKEVYPQWWASPGGDDSVAIKKAVDSAPDLPGITVKLIGNFHCKTTIKVNRHRAHIMGAGMYATQLFFNPESSAPLFEFKMDDKSMVVQCSIKDLALMGEGDTQKVGIRIVDADIIEVRNIAVQNWTGGGSIGLQIQGREMGFVENVCIVADLPISIEKNPNIKWIGIDHFTFRNTYLIVKDKNGPSVKIGSGIALTNVVFDGTNAWVKGKYGLYWVDTESKGVSLNLSIKNVRVEQGTVPDGHMIHIEHNYTLHNLVIENIYGCSGGVGGIYLRKCTNATLQNVFFTSVYKPEPAAFDIDESCSNIVLINAYWNAGTVSTGKLVKTFGTNLNPTLGRSRLVEVYDRPESPQGEGILIYGTRTWCYNGKLAKGASLSLPIGYGMQTRVATIIVSATDGASINESGQFMAGAKAKTVLVAGTERMKATPSRGNLCLIPGNKIQLINYLGAPVDVVITVFWK